MRGLLPADGRVFPATAPQTALMLEAMEYLRPFFRDAEVGEMGVGSGVLLLNAVGRLESARGAGTEIDPEAAALAGRNAQRLGMADRVEVMEGDFLEPLAGRRFDVLLLNAPHRALAEFFVIHAGDVLKRSGIALLMWNRQGSQGLYGYAHQQGLRIAPLLESGDGWRVYLLARETERMEMVRGAFIRAHAAAGLEEPVPLAEETERFLSKFPERPSLQIIHPPRGFWTRLTLAGMERVAPLLKGAEVLDIGAGSLVLSRAALELWGASRATATEIEGYPFEAVVREMPLPDSLFGRLQLLHGDLTRPVRGRRFDAALFNAPTPAAARRFVRQVGGVLEEPDGFALLMWAEDAQVHLRQSAREQGLHLAPLLARRYGEAVWKIFAIARTPRRLRQILRLAGDDPAAARGAGLEEGDAEGTQSAGLEGDLVEEAARQVRRFLSRLLPETGRKWVVLGPSMGKRYPGLEALERFLDEVSLDPGGEMTGLLAEWLRSRGVSEALYYGKPQEQGRFRQAAEAEGVAVSPKEVPPDAEFRLLLEQLLANIAGAPMGPDTETQRMLDRLSATLELLGGA